MAQLTDRRFLWVLLRAVGLTLLALGALTVGVGWLVGLLPEAVSLPWVGDVPLPLTGLSGLAVGAMLFASTFLMIPVAAACVGLFLDDVAAAVEVRHYPVALASQDQSWTEGLLEALWFTSIVVGVNLVALFVYVLAGPLAPLLFYALNGYLLGREYFVTVAARHMPMAEARALRARYGWRVWFAGVVMAVPLTIPIMNLLIPVLGVATFTHQFHRLLDRSGAGGSRATPT